MPMKFYFFTTIIIFFVVDVHASYAYIDPGAGSALLQSLIASISVGAAVFWGFRNKISIIFNRILGRKTEKPSTKKPGQKSDSEDEK